jgi:hypothetical protein
MMTDTVVMRTSGGLVQRNPTENRIRALLGALSVGEHVILEQFGSSASHYIQVWRRPDRVYQLEYRAGQPTEHYQSRTDSRDKVASALVGWSRGESAWRDDFEWVSIGHWFDR